MFVDESRAQHKPVLARNGKRVEGGSVSMNLETVSKSNIRSLTRSLRSLARSLSCEAYVLDNRCHNGDPCQANLIFLTHLEIPKCTIIDPGRAKSAPINRLEKPKCNIIDPGRDKPMSSSFNDFL